MVRLESWRGDEAGLTASPLKIRPPLPHTPGKGPKNEVEEAVSEKLRSWSNWKVEGVDVAGLTEKLMEGNNVQGRV
jgi:hypothetical protein